jgi:hypothetical protein
VKQLGLRPVGCSAKSDKTAVVGQLKNLVSAAAYASYAASCKLRHLGWVAMTGFIADVADAGVNMPAQQHPWELLP